MSDENETNGADAEKGDVDPNIRHLREKAKRTDEAEAALQLANRRISFLEAGVDLESPRGELLFRLHAGETTPEALRAEAARIGVPLKG